MIIDINLPLSVKTALLLTIIYQALQRIPIVENNIIGIYTFCFSFRKNENACGKKNIMLYYFVVFQNKSKQSKTNKQITLKICCCCCN